MSLMLNFGKKARSRNSRRAWLWALLCGAAGLALAIILVVAAARREDPRGRTYRIGWEDNPPFQVAGEGGKPTGLAVEIVWEAAQRRGIRLHWVRRPESSEAALRSGAADLWPLMTITEGRRRFIHLSEPYLENESCLLVRAASAFASPEDLAHARISYQKMPLDEAELHERFPAAPLVPTVSAADALRAVCLNHSDAAFVDEVSAISILLGGLPCAGAPFRLIRIPGTRVLLSVGSTFDAQSAADEIREEIGAMAKTGRLRAIMSAWSYVSDRNFQSLTAVLNEKRRGQRLAIGVSILGSLLVFCTWLAISYRRERDRARAADTALRQVERNLRLVADSLTEMVLAYDMRRNLIYANPAVEHLTGYSPDELREQGFICWIHAEDRARMLDYWEKLFQGTSFRDEEYRLVAKNGKEKWVSASWGPVLDEDGCQIGVRGSEKDITGRKDAEERLRASEVRFRSLVETIGEGFIEQSLDGVVTFASPAAAAIAGCTVEEIVGHHYSEFIHPDDFPNVAHAIETGLRTRSAQHVECRCRCKDGHFRWMRASGTFALEGDQVRGVRCLLIDIDDAVRVQAETRLLSEVVNQSADSIVITDCDGVIEYVNPAFERITGYNRAEAFGQTPRILKSGLQDAAFYQQLWSTILRGEVWCGRMINRRRDGSLYTEDCTIFPVANRLGTIEKFVAIKRDVTRELELEAQFNQAQKMESIGRLAGGIAHDFNNLLTVINGNAEVALLRLDRNNPLARRLAEILAAGERAADLTRQLLAFSRQQALQPAVVDLNELLRGAQSILDRLVGDDVVVECSLDDRVQPVALDASQAEQLIMNLVVNARDAMPDGGRILIRTTPLSGSDQAVPPGATAQGTFCVLEVQDSGHGMDEETKRRIFEPFFTTKDAGRGTGLGLSVVYGIVKQSGGWIEVDSAPGAGTTFRLFFPAVAAGPAVHGEALEAAPAGGTESILVVEDQPQVRQFVVEVLKQGGYSVMEAANADEALALVKDRTRPIHLLITDQVMPGKSGLVLAGDLKAVLPGLKVLCITGFAGNWELASAAPPGPFELLHKPFSSQSLLGCVRRLMDTA
jgi:two-component system cell cycle sensor histidine kinase/response regulator CckA